MNSGEFVELSDAQIAQINLEQCAATGENHALLDAGGLAAAAARPWSGFGETEFFPSLCGKAGALLHAIASRQIFENGNKRTAWVAAVTFLELNGADIGLVAAIQADAFVRAVSVDHTFAEGEATEWFEVALEAAQSRRMSGAFPDRLSVPVLFLANSATTTRDNLLDAAGAGWHHYNVPGLPGLVAGVLCGVIEMPVAFQGAPQALLFLVRDQEGQELGFRASSLISVELTNGPTRTVFAIPFSFIVTKSGAVSFEIAHEGALAAFLRLPVIAHSS